MNFLGDVELNPAPYKIIGLVQGSFNQGNVALLGETTGRQCACNALYAFCWSVVRDICCWKSVDLDYILVDRDQLHKSFKCQDYLNMDQLSRQVKIFEHTVNLKILEENLHDNIAVYGETFSTDVFTNVNVNTSTRCILFSLQYLKLYNFLYHDIEIYFDNISNFLINEKSQDSLLSNLLKNVDINEEIQMMAERNDLSVEEVGSTIRSISCNTLV